jgi:hypothetical protein
LKLAAPKQQPKSLFLLTARHFRFQKLEFL